MLPVALLAVTIPDNSFAAVPPVSVSSPSAQPVFSSGAQPDVLVAQAITPADTSTVVTSTGHQIDITGGQVSGDGGNVFHSFEQFGLGEQQTANFVANPQVQNILGRVQGGSASYIDGILRVSNSDANLYLLNPAGILFGQNARLDLNGSFTATTADQAGFEDGWFNGLGTTDYDQLVGNPNQFSFGAAEPGSVVNLGDLAVGNNQNLTLLGGNVINTGTVSAPGGQVTLSAVSGLQNIALGSADGLLTMELAPLASEQKLSALSLPELLTGGDFNEASELTVTANGTILLQGVTLPAGMGTTAVTGNLDVSGEIGGEINVLGDRIALLDANLDASGVAGGGTTRLGGGYQGNDNIPNANLTFFDADTTVDISAGETGDGGLAIAWADGLTQFYGHIDASGGNESGDGGFVEISGKNSLVFEGNVDLNAPRGRIGSLLLDPENITIIDADSGGNDDNDPVLDGPDVLLLSNFDPGNDFEISRGKLESLTGSITLSATNDITINDISFGSNNTLDLQASSSLFDAGNRFSMATGDTIQVNGGGITIQADTVELGTIRASDDVIVNAISDLTSRVRIFSGGDTVEITTQNGNLNLLSDSNIAGSGIDDTDIVLTALNGAINLTNTRIGVVSNGARDITLSSQSIQIENNSELSADSTLQLQTQDGTNNVTIDNSEASARQLIIDATGGILTIDNGILNSVTFDSSQQERLIQADAQIINIQSGSDLESRDSVRLEATESINIDDSSLETSRSDIQLSAESITVDGSRLEANQTLELLAQDTVQIVDPLAPSILQSRNSNLIVRGEQLVDIQSLNQPQSVLVANGDITLVSNNSVTGQGRFINGGDFSVLTPTDELGDFSYTPITSDGIISSAGSVSFGDYEGSALKVEAGGNITVDGNISITDPNSTILQGSDSDIAILSSEPALILRAGLIGLDLSALLPGTNELRNQPTVPPDQIIGMTTFTSSNGDSANGNITVGDIQTGRGPVILSASGDINTGNISTNDLPFTGEGRFDSSIELSAGGSIIAETVVDEQVVAAELTTGFADVSLTAEDSILVGPITTFGSGSSVELSTNTGDIQVDYIRSGSGGIDITAAGSFRAVESFNSASFSPAPINYPPLVDFLVAQGYDRDEVLAGNVRLSDGSQLPFSLSADLSDNEIPSIQIRYGDATRTIADLKFTDSQPELNTPESGRILILGDSQERFVVGPENLEFLPENDTDSLNDFEPSAPFDFTTGESTPYTYPSEDFPENSSGLAAGIGFEDSRSDTSLYGSLQSQLFEEVDTGAGAGGGAEEGGIGAGGGGAEGVTTVADVPQSVEQIETDTSSDICNEIPEDTVAVSEILSIEGELVAEGRSNPSSQFTTACAPVVSSESEDN